MHPLFARTSEHAVGLALGTRLRRLMLIAIVATLFLATGLYHLSELTTGEPMPPWVEAMYHIALFGCFTALWIAFLWRARERQRSQVRVFWTMLLATLAALLVGRGATALFELDGGSDAALLYFGFDIETGIPLTFVSVIKMLLLAAVEAGLAFFLLLRLRELVLFKRTRASLRNWYLMLGLMALSAGAAVGSTPGQGPSTMQSLLLVLAVVAMSVNALRVSWIVYLPLREKLSILGLMTLLLGLLAIGLIESDGSFVSGPYGYVQFYSRPLYFFCLLAFGFTALYSLSTFLFLLFHLPTTGDFQKKADEMTALQSLSGLIAQAFDRSQLETSITQSPVEAGAADQAWLLRYDDDATSLEPVLAAAVGISKARLAELIELPALASEVLSTRRALVLDNAPADHRIHARPGEGMGSLMALPLIARDDVLGVLCVARDVAQSYERDDLDALRVFATQAALALDNARFVEDRVEKERLEQELDIARAVQQKLLPQTLPTLAGLSIAATSTPALEVGGDYFDFVELDEKRLAFIVADVSGKGTQAAFYMAELKGIFRSLMLTTPDPHAFLSQANRALVQSLERNTFITGVYGVLDTEAETITLARAGHCPVVHAPLGADPRLLRSRGMGLGLDRGPLFDKTLAVTTTQLTPGDVFALYTDGVVESRNAQGVEYDYERLMACLAEHRHEEAASIHGAVLTDLRRFLGGIHYDDDLTLMVFKWHGLPDGFGGGGTAQRDVQPALESHVLPVSVLATPS
jgi:serine phosphatase RsbU (regulator of sigma subunit)